MLYAVTILLSAFLLFQVQPLIAKMILPWFGGSAAVWTTCMLFFQIVLLAGISVRALVVRRLAPRTQTLLHIALLAVSFWRCLIPSPAGNRWGPKIRRGAFWGCWR